MGDSVMAASVAPKSFFAHLFETSGVLAKVDAELVFFGDDDTIVTIEPSMLNFLTVLGECGLAQTQEIMDKVVHGGYAAVACRRQMEVA
jgi:hypothetical protein